MKKFRTILILALGLILLLVGHSSAKAEQLATSSRPNSGNLTIHKSYLPEGSISGENGSGSKNDEVPAEAIPLAGVHFDLYKIGKINAISVDNGQTFKPADEPAIIPVGESISYRYQVTGSEKSWQITAIDGQKHYRYQLEKVPNYTVGGQTDSKSGELSFTDLSAGEYLIIENLAKSKPITVAKDGETSQAITIDFAGDPIVTAVPLALTDRWNSDVHVYPKNKSNEILKELKATEPMIGDTVEYQISSAVPELISSYQRFDVWDELHRAHNLVIDSIKVYEASLVAGEQGKTIERVVDSNGQAVEVPQIIAGKTLWKVVTEGQRFTIQFTTAGRDYLETQHIPRIALAFKASLNEYAHTTPSDPQGNVVTNTGNVLFTNANGNDSHKPTNETLLPLVEVEVKKQNKANEPLKAKFAITTSKRNAQLKRFIQVKYGMTAGKKDLNKIESIVTPERSDYAKAIADPAYEDYQLMTNPKNGLARFIGLPMTEADYWITEIQTPKGYKPLSEPQLVKAGTEPVLRTKEKLAEYGNRSITVINVPLSDQPVSDDAPVQGGTGIVGGKGGNGSDGNPVSVANAISIGKKRLADFLPSSTELAELMPKTGSSSGFILMMAGIVLTGLIVIYYLNKRARRKD